MSNTPSITTNPIDGTPITAPDPPKPADTTPVPPAVIQAAEDKSVEKAKADAVVATNINATHAVKMSVKSPEVIAGASTGALIGTFVFPGVGTAVGGLIGGAVERYQIFGGPISKVVAKVKAAFAKKPAAAAATKPPAPTA